MVITKGKKKRKSSNKTLMKNEAAENALVEPLPSDTVTMISEDLKVDAQLEVEVDTIVDEASNENPKGISGEESERDEVGIESIDNYEGMSGEEESERVTKLDNDCQNTVVEEINGDLKVEATMNTFVDGQDEMPWENDEENTKHDSEEKVVKELNSSDEEASEEDSEDDQFSEEEETEDDDVDEDVSEEEEEEEEENEEEDGEETTPQEKEIEKQVAIEVEANEDGKKIEEHHREKLKTRLKNNKKSIQTSRKENTRVDKSKKLDLRNKPGSSRKRKAKKRAKNMGLIFMCNSKTKNDCYQYRVFGLPKSKRDLVEKIYIGMRLFLYDVDLKLMYGIYKAAGPGGYNIEPKAFKSQFPSQVRFNVLENCLPLAEEKFKNVIKDNYYTNTKFDCQLNSEQVKTLCKLFATSSKGYRPKKSRNGRRAEKLSVTKEGTRRQKVGRCLPLREEVQYERLRKRPRNVVSLVHERPRNVVSPVRERPRNVVSPVRKRPRNVVSPVRKRPRNVVSPVRKRPRNVVSPARQRPAPLPPVVPSSYAYERTSDVDTYKHNLYLDRRSPYRERRDGPLDRRDPYEGRRDPPMERNDHYGDGRDPYLDRHYAYKDGRDPYLERRDSYIDDRERDPYPRIHDPYRDGRDPYLELPNLYRDRQVPYIEGRGSYRVGQDTYLERRLPYKETTSSELYGTYRSDPVLDPRVEYRDAYRREEVLGHHDHYPSSSNLESRRRHDSYVSTRERPAYATDPVYRFDRY